MLSNGNGNALKYCCEFEGSIRLNDRRTRKKPVPRAAAGIAWQLKILKNLPEKELPVQIAFFDMVHVSNDNFSFVGSA